jgi:radical S-adenosyl methionine domain-containing protein 2
MVLLSLIAEALALRYFAGIALAACAYIVYKHTSVNSADALTHASLVQEPPADESVVKAPVIREPLDPSKQPDAPVSVNYFPSRECNYKCGFCFHTETSSYILTDGKAREGLRLL